MSLVTEVGDRYSVKGQTWAQEDDTVHIGK